MTTPEHRAAALAALAEIWAVHQNLRLGQLLCNLAVTWHDGKGDAAKQADPFFLPDEFVLARATQLTETKAE